MNFIYTFIDRIIIFVDIIFCRRYFFDLIYITILKFVVDIIIDRILYFVDIIPFDLIYHYNNLSVLSACLSFVHIICRSNLIICRS
jgi:hypothetical protein